MFPKKKSKTVETPLPRAPWVYVNDVSADRSVSTQLSSFIPGAGCIHLSDVLQRSSKLFTVLTQPVHRKSIIIITEDKTDQDEAQKQATVNVLKQKAIGLGCNFASINLYRQQGSENRTKFGTNYLELKVFEDRSESLISAKAAAEQIYKWLFTVFSVRETLHLIPDAQMRELEPNAYADHTYCPLNEARSRRKNGDVQVVVLILSKPVVDSGKKISFEVADKTGTAKFFFQHRGPKSQYTWEWCLNLKPGDRKSLPCMPLIEVKERTRTTILKAPLRASSALITGTGCLFQVIGNSLVKVGQTVKLGNRSEWVAEADVARDAKGREVKVRKCPEDFTIEWAESISTIQVFTATGEKTWTDTDSLASTSAGSYVDEKQEKLFV